MHDITLWRVRVTKVMLVTQQHLPFPSSFLYMWLPKTYRYTALSKTRNNAFHFYCFWTSKDFLLQLTTVSVKRPELVSVFFPLVSSRKIAFLAILYCCLLSVRFYHIFITLFHLWNNFRKTLLNTIWDLTFSTIVSLNISHCKEKSSTCYHKYIKSVHASCPIFLSGFKPSSISPTCFWKILKNEMSWKSLHWRASCRMLPDGQKDRRTSRQT